VDSYRKVGVGFPTTPTPQLDPFPSLGGKTRTNPGKSIFTLSND